MGAFAFMAHSPFSGNRNSDSHHAGGKTNADSLPHWAETVKGKQ